MGKIRYSMNVSLDGYIEDPDGAFDFAAPADDVHRAANDQVRRASALLMGRRMYEVLDEFWTAAATRDDLPEVMAEFAQVYVATPRVVFSDTLDRVPDGVRLVRSRNAVAEVTRLKRETDGELGVGGPGLAASLVDLIDEFELYVMPVLVGGGKPYLATRDKLRLRLAEHRLFASGAMYLRYERDAS